MEEKFANCVTNAISHYLDLFKKDFEKYLGNRDDFISHSNKSDKNDRNWVTLSKCHAGSIWRDDRKWSRKKEEPNIAYVMTNNIQQIRESLQELYITMGQEQLAFRAKDLFKLSQSQLSKTLGIWLKVNIFKIRLFGWKIVRFVVLNLWRNTDPMYFEMKNYSNFLIEIFQVKFWLII